jgi:hypothetical protein
MCSQRKKVETLRPGREPRQMRDDPHLLNEFTTTARSIKEIGTRADDDACGSLFAKESSLQVVCRYRLEIVLVKANALFDL